MLKSRRRRRRRCRRRRMAQVSVVWSGSRNCLYSLWFYGFAETTQRNGPFAILYCQKWTETYQIVSLAIRYECVCVRYVVYDSPKCSFRPYDDKPFCVSLKMTTRGKPQNDAVQFIHTRPRHWCSCMCNTSYVDGQTDNGCVCHMKRGRERGKRVWTACIVPSILIICANEW